MNKNVSIKELFRGISQLLEGEALDWYRFYGKECDTSEEFIKLLKEEFLPSSYDRKTLKEMYNRTQHTSESVVSYIYVMMTYFKRLDVPLPESEQIGIIKDNLAPYYKSKIFCDTFASVAELRARCKLLEDMKSECTTHVNPSTQAQSSLHPDLCYKTRTYSTPNRNKNVAVIDLKCKKCGRNGHQEKNCKFNRTIHCYGCGKVGVTRPQCDTCKSQRNLNSEEASHTENT